MLDLFSALAFLVVAAATLALVFHFFKQPTILAYLLAGGCAGLFGYQQITEHKEVFELFSQLGIVFLLFLVGLEINYQTLKTIGRDAALVGVGQVLFTALLGYGIATLFSFSPLQSLYIGFSLMLSSTIIVVNTLSERKELQSVYGKIALGILLIQDFLVLLALIVQGGFRGEGTVDMVVGSGTLALVLALLWALLKGIFLIGAAFYAGRIYIPKLFNAIARSTDLLFLASLSWLFILVSLVQLAGFSKEIGGFIAGITLAHSYERYQIAARLKPLRDFFLLIFFVTLGASLFLFTDMASVLIPIGVFSLFILVGNPFIVFLLMTVRGFSKRPAFFAGLTVSQISEFSFVFVAAGLLLGHVDERVVALVTSVGVLTIIVSTYLMTHAEYLYRKCAPYLTYFERKNKKFITEKEELIAKRILIIGFHRTGQAIAYSLPKEDICIVDFDPDMHAKIEHAGFASVFGDINDEDVRARINFKTLHAVVSTVPGIAENMLLLKGLAGVRKKSGNHFKIIMRARTELDARELYGKGADYVFVPHTTTGRFLARYIATDPYFNSLSALKHDDLASFSS